MSDLPQDLKYTASHEWLKVTEDGQVIMGITDHAQAALGDLVYVELPEEGSSMSQGDACAVVESVKAASDVYAPISGEILEVNQTLAEAPEMVNQQPYGDGWLLQIKPDDEAAIDALLDADAYQTVLDES